MRISDWSSDVCSSDLHHRDDRADPDDDAEDGQERAQQMAPDRSQREDEGGAQHQCALTRSPCRWRVSTLSTSPSLKLTIVCANPAMSGSRSEERRFDKGCVCTCRSRWSRYH